MKRLLVLFFLLILMKPSLAVEEPYLCEGINSSFRYSGKDQWETPYFDTETNTIIIFWEFIGKLSMPARQFVFYHECAHARGIIDEIKADEYAYYVLRNKGIDFTGPLVDEICKSHHSEERCTSLLEWTTSADAALESARE